MGNVYEKLLRCHESLMQKIDFKPQVALVLGSGLGDYADEIDVFGELSYSELDGFPVSTVSGHEGKFIFGSVNGIPLVCMKGRVHYYEGYDMSDVVLPIRLMGLMGAKVLFLTNAAGGVSLEFKAGDFMLIRDQISSLVPSPLIGKNLDRLGARFPDMSNIYDNELCGIIKESAEKLGILLKEGTYIQLTGPNYETPAEVRMCRLLGADAVGMSTGCEAVAANHMGMRICGISFISNMACGVTDTPLSHEEVKNAADNAAPRFKKLVTESITGIGGLSIMTKK